MVYVVYLIGFTGELAATKLALDLALGAIVLQVVGQVAARQLDGAAVGAGYHIEGAGGEVALRETQRQRGHVSSEALTNTVFGVWPGQKTTRDEEGRHLVSERDTQVKVFDKAIEIKEREWLEGK